MLLQRLSIFTLRSTDSANRWDIGRMIGRITKDWPHQCVDGTLYTLQPTRLIELTPGETL